MPHDNHSDHACCGGGGCGGHGHGEHHGQHPAGAQRHQCGAGAEAVCVCPKCGAETPHHPGQPCKQATCEACGKRLMRKGSFHHTRLLARARRKTP